MKNIFSRIKKSELFALLAIIISIVSMGVTVYFGHESKIVSINQVRSYVSISTTFMDAYLAAEPKFRNKRYINTPAIFITIQNSGLTPANHLKDIMHMVVGYEKNEDRFIVNHVDDISYSDVTPQATVSKLVTLGRNLTNEEIKEINSGKLNIYLYGRIEYFDVFGNLRFENIRMKYTGVYPPKVKTSSMTFCNNGNDSN